MDDYDCPKCKRKAVAVKYRERHRLEIAPKRVMDYRCPGGHKWIRALAGKQKQT